MKAARYNPDLHFLLGRICGCNRYYSYKEESEYNEGQKQNDSNLNRDAFQNLTKTF